VQTVALKLQSPAPSSYFVSDEARASVNFAWTPVAETVILEISFESGF